VLQNLRDMPYVVLVDRYLDQTEHHEVVADSGTRYQVEVQGFWDGGKPGDLRVIAAVYDGGWRAFVPLSRDFIMVEDGSFVGE